MTNMWMVRSGVKGFLFKDFKNLSIIAVGWNLGDYHIKFPEEIIDILCVNYSNKTDNQLTYAYS